MMRMMKDKDDNKKKREECNVQFATSARVSRMSFLFFGFLVF
jgi:hypothetical protein